MEAEAAVGLAGAPRSDLNRQVGRARVADENQTGRFVRIRAVGHPALLRHDLDVRNCRQQQQKKINCYFI